MLARRTGLPVYPIGVAAEKAWVLKSWDAFVIPKPGTKIVVVVAPPLRPETLSDTPVEMLCARLKEALQEANRQAERFLRS